VQANNVYLEVLADLGVLGLVTFLWLIATPVLRARSAMIEGTDTKQRYIASGVILAIGAFLLHGLLDAFLAFTPTVMLLWMLLGAALAQKPQVSGRW
jgi:O-antigen ligase